MTGNKPAGLRETEVDDIIVYIKKTRARLLCSDTRHVVRRTGNRLAIWLTERLP